MTRSAPFYLAIALGIGLLLVSAVEEGGASGPPDTDADTVPDSSDNCVVEFNSTQEDADQDGYGNICDADFDNDHTVGNSDIPILGLTFSNSGSPSTRETDLDVDGVTGIADVLLFRSFFGGAPGPSGLSCAGTTPCP